MRKAVAAALIFILLLPLVPGLANQVSVLGIPVDRDAEYLDLGDMKVTQFTRLAQELEALPNLKQVDLFNSRPSEKQAFALQSALPQVRFGLTMNVAGFTCRTDDVIFSMHRRGQPLYRSSAFSQLTLCPDMLALDLGHNRITDLGFLTRNPKLKYLILADNQIRDLSPLAELKELEYLELFMNQITDITPLSGLTELKDLNLSHNQLTDLTPLYGLYKLERIWLLKNGLSKEQVAALQEALPHATIYNSSYMSTGGGWREHPRYFAMRHTFDRGEFIPFDNIPPEIIKK